MAKPIRLIALDLDGTLLCGDPLAISPENLAALREASAQGIELVLCTGRMVDDAALFALRTGLSMRIIGRGGPCRTDVPLGPVVRSHMIKPEDMAQLIPLLMDRGLCLGLCREHDLLITHPPKSDETLTRVWGTHVLSPEGRCRVYRGAEHMDEFIRSGVNNIVVLGSPAKLNSVKGDLARRFPHLDVIPSWAYNVEITPGGVTKGSAIAELAGELNIPMSQVMAIGDHDNDVSMLRCTGYGVAMGNATPAARESARYITLPCEENGVAAAIRTLALGESVVGVYAR